MKTKTGAFFAVAALAFALTLLAAAPPNITGLWTGTLTMNDGGQDALTLVISLEEDEYSGTWTDEMRVMPENTELEDVALDGNTLTFTITTSDGIPITVTLTAGKDSLTGRWEDKSNETSGAVELTRKK